MSSATATNEKLTTALAYAEKRGWAVLPLHSVNAAGTCTCGTAPCCRLFCPIQPHISPARL